MDTIYLLNKSSYSIKEIPIVFIKEPMENQNTKNRNSKNVNSCV